jgi:DNA mismatch repair protein MutS2
MIHIHEKTLQDLEFQTVLQQVSELCVTPLGNEKALQISPYKTYEKLLIALQLTNEYVSSLYNDNRIPNHGFDTITKEIQLLNIENTYLEVHGLKKIVGMSITVNALITFLNKFEEYYPNLNQFASHIEVTKILIEKVNIIKRKTHQLKHKLK